MALTNLTNTKWVIDKTEIPNGSFTFNLNFNVLTPTDTHSYIKLFAVHTEDVSPIPPEDAGDNDGYERGEIRWYASGTDSAHHSVDLVDGGSDYWNTWEGSYPSYPEPTYYSGTQEKATIHITGGADVTNTQAIQLLQGIGTKVETTKKVELLDEDIVLYPKTTIDSVVDENDAKLSDIINGIRHNYMPKHTFNNDIFSAEFYNLLIATPDVNSGDLFVVHTQTETPQSAIAKGFPALEVGSVVYGYLDLGQLDSPFIAITSMGLFKITDGSGALTCENIGGSELTPATASTLGGVKVGSGLSVTADGTLSAKAKESAKPLTRVGSLPTADASEYGKSLIYDKDSELNYIEPSLLQSFSATKETLADSGSYVSYDGNEYIYTFGGNKLKKYSIYKKTLEEVGTLSKNLPSSNRIYANGSIYVFFNTLEKGVFKINVETANVEKIAEIPEGVDSFQASGLAVVGNIIYIIGGFKKTPGSSGDQLKLIYGFDTTTNNFVYGLNALPFNVKFPNICVKGNDIFVIGSNDATFTSQKVGIYNTITHNTKWVRDLPTTSYMVCGCVASGNYVIIIGYYSSAWHVFRYNISGDTYEDLGVLSGRWDNNLYATISTKIGIQSVYYGSVSTIKCFDYEYKKIGGSEPQSVTINQPASATNGNLTAEQLATLQANDLNYIIFNNEIFSLNDKTHTADTLTYSHVGYENGKHLVKTISITISTKAWVMNTSEIGGGGESISPYYNPDDVSIFCFKPEQYKDYLIISGTNVDVDWGDGTKEVINGNDVKHKYTDYSKPITAIVKNGELTNFNINEQVYYIHLGKNQINNMNAKLMTKKNLEKIDNFDFGTSTTANDCFKGCSKLTDVSHLNTKSLISMQNMFRDCITLQNSPLMDTSEVTDMQGLFRGCKLLTNVPVMNTSKVTNTYFMFGGCTSLTTIPIIDTSKVIDAGGMFNGCSSLVKIPELNMYSCTSGVGCYGCSSLRRIEMYNIRSTISISQTQVLGENLHYLIKNCLIKEPTQEKILVLYVNATQLAQITEEEQNYLKTIKWMPVQE